MQSTKILQRSALERKVAVIVGTRPGIIKHSPTIRELARRQVPFLLIHTGQHYSPSLDEVFFRDLELAPPDVQLPALDGYTLHGEQTAEMLKTIEKTLVVTRPMAVLVGGDANTNLAGALAARKLNIQVCHEEAGLRSYDWLMPEEHNRVMMDHISEFLFAPNDGAADTLASERVRGRVTVTGSPIVDVVAENRNIAERKSQILTRLGLDYGRYILMTVHHEETVDYSDTLVSILDGAQRVIQSSGMTVVFPAHPRTRKRLREFGLMERVASIRGLLLAEPLGYLDFLMLHSGAALTMTESGGVIQEAAILGVPCVTLGRVTEWRDTVRVGANLVAGTRPADILEGARTMLSAPRNWTQPFGPPGAAQRVVDVIEREVLDGNGFMPERPNVPRSDSQE